MVEVFCEGGRVCEVDIVFADEDVRPVLFLGGFQTADVADGASEGSLGHFDGRESEGVGGPSQLGEFLKHELVSVGSGVEVDVEDVLDVCDGVHDEKKANKECWKDVSKLFF